MAREKKASITNPNMVWVLDKIPHARFISLARSVYDSKTKGLDTWQLSKDFLGVSAYKQDATTGRFFVNRGKIEALSNLLERINDVDSGSAPNMGRYRRLR
jgi:hypothetical protein